MDSSLKSDFRNRKFGHEAFIIQTALEPKVTRLVLAGFDLSSRLSISIISLVKVFGVRQLPKKGIEDDRSFVVVVEFG